MSAVLTRIPLQAPVEVARNLIRNPSFEVDTSGFLSGGGAPVLARIGRTVDPIGGAFLLRVTTAAAGNADVDIYRPTGPDGTLAAVPGNSYTLSVVNGLTRAGRTLQLIMRFYDAGGTQLGTNIASVAAAVVANTRYSVSTGPAPAGSVTIRPFLRFAGATAAGEFIYLDQFMLTATPSLIDYFDGATPKIYSPSFVNYGWTGTANASESVMQTAGPADILTPLFVQAPVTFGRESRALVHELLDDPSQSWATLRKAGRRAGEWDAYFGSSAAALAAVDALSAATHWNFNASGDASLGVPKFVIAPGQRVTAEHVMAEGIIRAATGSDFLWKVTIPWQGVTP